MWWVSDTSRFENHYPEWQIKHGIKEIMRAVIEGQSERLFD